LRARARDVTRVLADWRDLYRTYRASWFAVKPGPLRRMRSRVIEALAAFDRETDIRRRFRTELKDLREALRDSSLREHLGPFLVRVEKFSLEFHPGAPGCRSGEEPLQPLGRGVGRPSGRAHVANCRRVRCPPALVPRTLCLGAPRPHAGEEGGGVLISPQRGSALDSVAAPMRGTAFSLHPKPWA